jgi:hypothetical protein
VSLILWKADFDGIDETRRAAVTRIEAFAKDAPGANGFGWYPQRLGYVRSQSRFRFIKLQAKIGDAQRHRKESLPRCDKHRAD